MTAGLVLPQRIQSLESLELEFTAGGIASLHLYNAIPDSCKALTFCLGKIGVSQLFV